MRLASQGIAVAPGGPFTVLPDAHAHVRVTTGAVHDNLAHVARIIAEAAQLGPGRAMAR
jgi:aspartate/methionine/tyrosine aminotransferase